MIFNLRRLRLLLEENFKLRDAVKELEEERNHAFMLLADAYDDDCGLAAWNGNEEFLLKVLKEMHDPTDRTSNYEAQIEHLEEGSQGMTLEEFVVQLHEEVDTFRGNWIERNKHSGDQRYPMSFSVDEWYEQYLAWMGVQEG